MEDKSISITVFLTSFSTCEKSTSFLTLRTSVNNVEMSNSARTLRISPKTVVRSVTPSSGRSLWNSIGAKSTLRSTSHISSRVAPRPSCSWLSNSEVRPAASLSLQRLSKIRELSRSRLSRSRHTSSDTSFFTSTTASLKLCARSWRKPAKESRMADCSSSTKRSRMHCTMSSRCLGCRTSPLRSNAVIGVFAVLMLGPSSSVRPDASARGSVVLSMGKVSVIMPPHSEASIVSKHPWLWECVRGPLAKTVRAATAGDLSLPPVCEDLS
mmetsp:Transcript_41099/g.81112  ORF Transcript_41099/g.81112 Transcript_41099/m.81112 type:complete len:269 (-) Transcript_41099:6-812(-)